MRILSLDGGGSYAGIHARALGAIFGRTTPGRDIVREFDLVAGNSGGSIVMTALCCNYTPEEIVAFYSDPATLRRLFSPRWVAAVPVLRWLLPRYSSKGKFAALKWIFDRKQQSGEVLPSSVPMTEWPKLLGSPTNLLVTAFDYDRERAAFFRSDAASLAKSSARQTPATLVEAVHASTNAPIRYYDEPANVAGRRYWDGALGGYNNPVLAAVVEVLANNLAKPQDVRVLSLGTGAIAQPLTTEGAEPPLGKPPAAGCLLTAVKKAATVIFADPPDAASFHAHVALGQPVPATASTSSVEGNVVRLCPLLRPRWDDVAERWTLPEGISEDDYVRLGKMSLDVMSKRDLLLIYKMCDLWIADKVFNQPIRMGHRMRCDIGHEKFSHAVAHWERIATH